MPITSVQQLLNDPRNRRTLNGLTDLTHKFLIDPDKETFLESIGRKADKKTLNQFYFFDRFAPVEMSDDFSLLQWQLKRNMSVASLISTSGEIPSSRMGQLIKIEGGLAKLALQHDYDEETQIRIIELGRQNNLPRSFVDMLYGSVNDLQRRIMKMANILTAQMFYQGFVGYIDPRTNQGIDIKYDVRPQLFPQPIDPNFSWDNYTNANGIQNILDHSYQYYQVNGFYPDYIVMSTELLRHLLRQQSTASYAQANGLISGELSSSLPKRVTRKVLDQLIEDTPDLPKIIVWDAQYELEIAPSQTTRARYIPSHTYCFASENIGRRIFAPTLESALANSGKPKPGIYLKVGEILKSSPIQERSYGVARMIPHCEDTRLLGAWQVVTTA